MKTFDFVFTSLNVATYALESPHFSLSIIPISNLVFRGTNSTYKFFFLGIRTALISYNYVSLEPIIFLD